MTVPNLHFCIFFQFSIQTLAFACIHNEFVEAGISLPSINKLCKYSANKSDNFFPFLVQRKLSKRFFRFFLLRFEVAERKGKGLQPTVVTFLPFLSTRRTALHQTWKGTGSLKLHSKQKAAKSFRSPKNTRRCAINRSRKATPFSKLWDCVIRSGEVRKILPRIDLIIAKH